MRRNLLKIVSENDNRIFMNRIKLYESAFIIAYGFPKKQIRITSRDSYFRGPERIRTAVEAFAELCLATRPQDLIF
jgi:hypothetical protein